VSNQKTKKLLLLAVLAFLLSPLFVFSQEFSSTDFKVLDPVIFPGGFSTSTDFQLHGVITQIATGTSTDSSFRVNSGFLFFPFINTPVVSATAGDAQVSLSWTVSVGALGWTVSNYNVGRSTVSGGPYTYSSVGSTTSATVSGLTNGTTYFFVVRPEDAFGNSIATSTQVSATPAAAAAPPPSGGGGGGAFPSTATVVFAGRAYPRSTVTILRDAQVVVTVTAGSDANFGAQISGLAGGQYIFSVYAEDYQGRRSSILTFPVIISTGSTTNVSGIFLAPTIALDKLEVKRGDTISIFGQSTPLSDITIVVNSDQEFFSKTISDPSGIYLYSFDSTVLELGDHAAKSKASIANQLVSGFSNIVNFKVGTKNVVAAPVAKCPSKGDLNGDCKVNLVDFSVAAFWWKRPLTATAQQNIDNKLFPDGKIDLRDFSILAFYWTG